MAQQRDDRLAAHQLGDRHARARCGRRQRESRVAFFCFVCLFFVRALFERARATAAANGGGGGGCHSLAQRRKKNIGRLAVAGCAEQEHERSIARAREAGGVCGAHRTHSLRRRLAAPPPTHHTHTHAPIQRVGRHAGVSFGTGCSSARGDEPRGLHVGENAAGECFGVGVTTRTRSSSATARQFQVPA